MEKNAKTEKTIDTKLVDRAVAFAAEMHSGAVRKGTSIPYIVHPMETAAIVAGMTDDQNVIAAAVLHDTLEDTAATADMLTARFGQVVTDLVQAESENKREDQPAESTWKTRKQETVDHLRRSTNTNQKMIAFADKLSNIRAIYRDHCSCGDELWKRFNQNDPRQICWYYASVLQACKEFKGTPQYDEYKYLLRATFGEEVMNYDL